ncbi:response regulator [Paenibacillus elgii]|uniref:response regulator n=1 Tax=Paenibacillus elgii TaxID=189691 RepID=UPI002040B8A4|nr:response regulator [Paenibacillus elgii]MCM3270848.1 response regulator [Paenibacillus elgii]
MRKVLIVDDELLVRVGLKSTIRWEENGYTVIGDARNGKEAIELFEKHDADIIITDISMPLIDGMELIKILKSKKESLKFIILSHHDDFKFAQEAIDLGVVKYILKHELTEAVLLQVLEKLNDNDQGLSNGNPEQGMQERKHNDELYRWFNHRHLSLEPEAERAGSRPLALFKEPYFIVSILMKFHDHPADRSTEQMMHYYKIIDHVSRELADEEHISLFLVTGGNEMIYVVQANEMPLDQNKLKEFMLTVRKNVKRITDLKLIVGISELSETRETMREAYRQAKRAQELGFFQNDEIWSYKKENQASSHFPFTLDEDRLLKLLNQRTTELESYLETMFNQLYHIKNTAILQEVTRQLKKLAVQLRNEKQLDPMEIDEAAPIEEFSSFSELKIHFVALFTKIADAIPQDEDPQHYSYHVRKVIHYFKENYHKNLSLAEVADYLQINKSYLSVHFKQETGVNFSVYLTKLRIEKAKELLRTTDKKIYEIAEEVGFDSPYYFSTVFKSFTQLSCKEYRDKFYVL